MNTRAQALNLLQEYTQSESLLRHAYAVEAAMRAYARQFGEDEEKWGITGLLHDFDYERYPTPTEHTLVGAKILMQKGYPEDVIQAIQAHADYNGLPRDTPMARTLYACDELSGFVMAVAMVRPSRNIADVEVKSVKKKLKDKAFAKGISRQDVLKGAEEMNLPLEQHIATVVAALVPIAGQLGLAGDGEQADNK
ncbi:HDIG domain-containing protein [Alicyclobacillaceae bacterium I2511]|nr:HDIG domain-containing protein [Alicyclobacillaceae bacterium I2511]